VSNLSDQNQPSAPRLGRSVSIDQAAHLLNVSRRTVYYRIREGRLRTIRTLGGSQRVLLKSIAEHAADSLAARAPALEAAVACGRVTHS
jgi:excisionase family DNA binding protein